MDTRAPASDKIPPMEPTSRKTASEYPQELLDLFHEYQHGEISRRDFLDRAKRYAVGGITVMALFESLRPNYAFAQQVAKDDARIVTSYETVPSPLGNGSIKGYFAKPKNPSGKLPAVLVIHENRGLNPYIEDVVASFDWLKKRDDCTGKVGAVGFCFGGGVVNHLAWARPELSAGVPFYGTPPGPDDVKKIKAPMLIHHGEMDTRLAGTWPAYDAALTAAGVTHEGFIYPGAQHGFHNDTTPRYDEKAAKLAWDRTLAWFNKYLR